MTNDNPHSIPGYEILNHLGQGGMAEVYVANQLCFDRKVALKVLSSSDDDSEFRRRFLQEAKIVAQLSHAHIIGVHDVGEITGSYYIAMDYLPGDNLKDLIKEGLKPKSAFRIIKQITDALDFAHRKGFVHRDVKSENVLFREDGSAILTDFGIATDTRKDQTISQTGLVYGTPNYMSPEQAFGQPTDLRTDIYSLGVMFYEMLTHRLPYRASNPIDLAMMHHNDPIPLLPLQLNRLQPLIDKLLAKSPDNRYQTAKEFALELEQFTVWDIDEFDEFDAKEHFAFIERTNERYNTEKNENHSGFHPVLDIPIPENRLTNPFSQRDFSGLFIKFLFVLAVSLVLVTLFTPDFLNGVPYYDKYKVFVETLLASSPKATE